MPPPFNLFPTVKLLRNIFGCGKAKRSTKSIIVSLYQLSLYNHKLDYFNDPQKKSKEKVQRRHDNVMRLLVRRFITAEQRKRDDFGVTEDDVMEIRQDISTLRYELIDIFHKNGMKTPRVDPNDNQRKTNTVYRN